MRPPLRYILFGAHPHWCKVILPQLTRISQATCAALVEPDILRREAGQKWLALDNQRCFSEPSAALQNCPADFAIITTPGVSHEQLVDQCLTFDLNMLIEPPLAETMPAACRIYRKVRDIGKRLVVAAGAAFEQDKLSLIAAIQRRESGRLNYVSMRFSQNLKQRNAWLAHRHNMPH